MKFLMSLWLFLFGQTIQITNADTTFYENVEQAVVREFGIECDIALSVFRAESGLRPFAEGDHGSSIGIAQIHLPAHSKKIPDKDKKAWLKNFQNNLSLAKEIREKSGWEAWSVYKSGSYKIYLDEYKSCLKYVK